jgi:ABC-type lipoprotein export system ATPase subunit
MAEAPESSFHRICNLQVKGGFLEGVGVEFADSLNCVIGGRGTGKTTVLEVLRWALDQMPDSSVAPSLHRAIDKLVKANLGNGQVEVEIETGNGLRYRVRRSGDDAPLVMNEAGNPVEIDLGRGTIFSAEVYSQNQIEEIANDPLFQLKLIDKFVAEKINETNGQIEVCIRELRANAHEIIKLREDVATLKEKVSLLPEVTEKLKAYKLEDGDEEGKALRKGSEDKALRDHEQRTLDRIQEALSETAEKLRDVITDLPDELIDQTILDGPNGKLFREIGALCDDGIRQVREKIEEAAVLAEGTRDDLLKKGKKVSTLHLKQEKAYQELLESREKEKDRASERDKLVRRQAELQEEQKKLESRQAELSESEKTRTTLLRRLSDMRDVRFAHRTEVAGNLNSQLSPTIRVTIEQYGNTDSYRDLLLEAMKGSGFKYTQVVDRVIQRIPPHELAATVQRGDAQALAEQLDIDADRANRMLLQLKDKPVVFDVEIVDLYDRPTIELKDGLDYKDSTALSTGQRCTTILPILLLESASPLLIDQPEDNLDNAFIYETVVKSVRGVRGKRQLIFVTHNPNIPVLGDAQRVMVLQSTGRRASVKAVGNVDEVKEEIEFVLEGGREAFQRRKARYGY